MQLPYDIPTFPEILSNNGYKTEAIGKMHFSPARSHNGFNRMHLMEEIPYFLEDDDYAMYLNREGYGKHQSLHGVRHLLYMMPQQSMIPTKHHGSTWVADRTIEVIEKNADQRPFMIWSSFIEPHPPFDVPHEWANMYKDSDLPDDYDSITPLSTLAKENKCIANYPPNKDYLRRVKELYYSAISFVDYNIGKIIDTLERTGQLDNTLIVFTSDHGEMLGDNGTYQKFLPYDGSAKIPFIVRYPKYVTADTVEEKFVDLNDLLPTFLDATKLTYPSNNKLPGESIFIENGQKNRDYQYIEHNKGSKRWISIRDSRYKYNYYYGGGHEELFDLVNDQREQVNLLHKPEVPSLDLIKVHNKLRNKLIEYEEKWGGLEGYVVNGDFIKLEEYEAFTYHENTFPRHTKAYYEIEKSKLLALHDEIFFCY